MNAKQKISIVTLTGIALAVSYWTGYVHGSSSLSSTDKFISVALPIIFIWTLAKLTFHFFFSRGSMPPSSEPPPIGPSAGVPAPRPPGAPPVIYCEEAV